MLFGRVAVERHDYTATKAERLQNAKHWMRCLNVDGPQKPPRQRPEFAVALKQCHKMQDAHLAVLQRATGKPVGSVFIFNIAVARLTMSNELELMLFLII